MIPLRENLNRPPFPVQDLNQPIVSYSVSAKIDISHCIDRPLVLPEKCITIFMYEFVYNLCRIIGRAELCKSRIEGEILEHRSWLY